MHLHLQQLFLHYVEAYDAMAAEKEQDQSAFSPLFLMLKYFHITLTGVGYFKL